MAIVLLLYIIHQPGITIDPDTCKSFIKHSGITIPFIFDNKTRASVGYMSMQYSHQTNVFNAIKRCVEVCTPVMTLEYSETNSQVFTVFNASGKEITKSEYSKYLNNCLSQNKLFSSLVGNEGHSMLVLINPEHELILLGSEIEYDTLHTIFNNLTTMNIKKQYIRRCTSKSQNRLIQKFSDGITDTPLESVRNYLSNSFNISGHVDDRFLRYMKTNLVGSCVTWSYIHFFMILHNQDKSIGDILRFLDSLSDFELIQLSLEFQKNMSDIITNVTPSLNGYNTLAKEFLQVYPTEPQKLFK